MKSISTNCRTKNDMQVINDMEKRYSIKIRDNIKDFIRMNSGGFPKKSIIRADGENYEVRVFLSLDKTDEYYYIDKPLTYFSKKTNGKIIPLGLDSGDNYYCANNENGKVYYWSADDDLYYCIADSIDDFVKLFE